MEVVGAILLRAGTGTREQNGKPCLNPERRTERGSARRLVLPGIFSVQLVEQRSSVSDFPRRGGCDERMSVKFYTLGRHHTRCAVRDGNCAERGGAGGNSAGSRIGEGIVERDGRRGYSEEPFLHISGKPAWFSPGEKNGNTRTAGRKEVRHRSRGNRMGGAEKLVS